MKTAIAYLLPAYCAAMLLLLIKLAAPPSPAPEEANPKHTSSAPHFAIATPNFRGMTDIAERKRAFFDFLRPMISEQNQLLQQQRIELTKWQAIMQGGGTLARQERRELYALAESFNLNLEEQTPVQLVSALLLRVNIIPEAMVLAQAASESAWGTSRFAREGNNFFGQWCYSEGCGMVPNRRMQGAAHEVAVFASPYESVAAYFHNINTHRAYRELRKLRQQRVLEELPLTALSILPGLRRYSQRGEEYLNEIKEIIRYNQLAADKQRSQQ